MSQITPESRALILFNATLTAIAAIDDANYRHNAKKWLEVFRKQGNNLWKEIKRNTSDLPQAFETYEELGAIIYEKMIVELKKICDENIH